MLNWIWYWLPTRFTGVFGRCFRCDASGIETIWYWCPGAIVLHFECRNSQNQNKKIYHNRQHEIYNTTGRWILKLIHFFPVAEHISVTQETIHKVFECFLSWSLLFKITYFQILRYFICFQPFNCLSTIVVTSEIKEKFLSLKTDRSLSNFF